MEHMDTMEHQDTMKKETNIEHETTMDHQTTMKQETNIKPDGDLEPQNLEPTWRDLLRSTFNQVNAILGEAGMGDEMIDEDMEDMIEQAVSNDLLSDSRLDANSILIEDIQLDEDEDGHGSPGPRDRSNSWHGTDYPPSCSPTGSHTSSGSVGTALALVSEEAAASPGSAEGAAGKGKLNTRKNPWGNLSYAELIVQVLQMAINDNHLCQPSRRSRAPPRAG
jgi:hypothetical protein